MILNRGPVVEMDNGQYIFDYSGCAYLQG
ncbi:hypothetical protein [Pueribacillus sp. YX66]